MVPFCAHHPLPIDVLTAHPNATFFLVWPFQLPLCLPSFLAGGSFHVNLGGRTSGRHGVFPLSVCLSAARTARPVIC